MFFITLISARLLSQYEFGLYSFIRSTVIYGDSLATNTYGLILLRNTSSEKHNPSIVEQFIVSSLAVGAAYVLLISILGCTLFYLQQSSFNPGNIAVINIYIIGSLMLLFSVESSFLNSALIGLHVYNVLALIGIFNIAVMVPVSIYLVSMYSLRGALLSVSIFFLLDFAIKLYSLANFGYIRFRKIDFGIYKKKAVLCVKESIPLIGGVIVNGGAFWLGRLILLSRPGGPESIAIFDVSFQWLSLLMLISNSIISVIYSKMSRDPNRLANNVNHNRDLLLLLSVTGIMALCSILLSKNILLIYGEKYLDGTNVFLWMCVASIFFTGALFHNRVMLVRKRSKYLLYSSLVSGISMHMVYYIVGYTSVGMAISVCAYYFSNMMFYMALEYKYACSS